MGTMMRPRRRGKPKTAEEAPAEVAPEVLEVLPEEPAPAPDEAPVAVAPAPVSTPTPEPALPPVQRQRYIINLNMLSNVDVKFYTEGASKAEVLARWREVIGRSKREQPENTVEVVMGAGDASTSYILYLAEVTAFAIGPFVDDSDAIDCIVNV